MKKPSLEEFIHLLKEVLRLDKTDAVTGKMTLMELGADSIAMMHVMHVIDSEYGVVMSVSDLYESVGIEDLYNRLLSKLN